MLDWFKCLILHNNSLFQFRMISFVWTDQPSITRQNKCRTHVEFKDNQHIVASLLPSAKRHSAFGIHMRVSLRTQFLSSQRGLIAGNLYNVHCMRKKSQNCQKSVKKAFMWSTHDDPDYRPGSHYVSKGSQKRARRKQGVKHPLHGQ